MSVERGDFIAEGMSHCCSASVIDPSGENIEGFCSACKEHCSVISQDDCKHDRGTASGDDNHTYWSCADCDYFEEL